MAMAYREGRGGMTSSPSSSSLSYISSPSSLPSSVVSSSLSSSSSCSSSFSSSSSVEVSSTPFAAAKAKFSVVTKQTPPIRSTFSKGSIIQPSSSSSSSFSSSSSSPSSPSSSSSPSSFSSASASSSSSSVSSSPSPSSTYSSTLLSSVAAPISSSTPSEDTKEKEENSPPATDPTILSDLTPWTTQLRNPTTRTHQILAKQRTLPSVLPSSSSSTSSSSSSSSSSSPNSSSPDFDLTLISPPQENPKAVLRYSRQRAGTWQTSVIPASPPSESSASILKRRDTSITSPLSSSTSPSLPKPTTSSSLDQLTSPPSSLSSPSSPVSPSPTSPSFLRALQGSRSGPSLGGLSSAFSSLFLPSSSTYTSSSSSNLGVVSTVSTNSLPTSPRRVRLPALWKRSNENHPSIVSEQVEAINLRLSDPIPKVSTISVVKHSSNQESIRGDQIEGGKGKGKRNGNGNGQTRTREGKPAALSLDTEEEEREAWHQYLERRKSRMLPDRKRSKNKLFDAILVVGIKKSEKIGLEEPAFIYGWPEEEKKKSKEGRREQEQERNDEDQIDNAKDKEGEPNGEIEGEEEGEIGKEKKKKKKKKKKEGKTAFLMSSAIPFCFPDMKQFLKERTGLYGEQFSFTLTASDGTRRVGYCKRFNDGRKSPLCFCVISVLQCNSLFEKILDLVVERYDSVKSTTAVTEFAEKLYDQPFPFIGEVVNIYTRSPFTDSLEEISLRYSFEFHLDNCAMESLLCQLSSANFVFVFSALLVERRILFFSENTTTLSKCVQAAVSIIFPLTWQHIYIPILPPSLLSCVCAPMPFVIGCLKSCMNEVNNLPMDEVLIVNLDEDELYIIGSEEDRGNKEGKRNGVMEVPQLFPEAVVSSLQKSIAVVRTKVKKIMAMTNFMEQRAIEAIRKEKKKLQDVFLNFFAALLAFYTLHLTQAGNFDKEGFVSERSQQMEPFFKLFVMSQSFERFVAERSTGNANLFGNEFENMLATYESRALNPKWWNKNAAINTAMFLLKSGHWNFLRRLPQIDEGSMTMKFQ